MEQLVLLARLQGMRDDEADVITRHFGKGYLLAQHGLLQVRLAVLALLDPETGAGPLPTAEVAKRLGMNSMGDLPREILAQMEIEGLIDSHEGTLWRARRWTTEDQHR